MGGIMRSRDAHWKGYDLVWDDGDNWYCDDYGGDIILEVKRPIQDDRCVATIQAVDYEGRGWGKGVKSALNAALRELKGKIEKEREELDDLEQKVTSGEYALHLIEQ
jgi:hypothetical protein